MQFSSFVPGFLLGGLLISHLAAQSNPSVPVYRWSTLAGRASAGNEGGAASDARFNHPHGLARDLAGNLYVADTGNHTIRKISPDGFTSTFAGLTGLAGSSDGTGPAARFNAPQGLAVDAGGNLYVADTGNHTIRKITPTGVVTTLAGQAGKAGRADGAAAAALFDSPDRLTVDADGTVYLANGGARKISGGTVQTISIPAAATLPNGQMAAVSVFGCPAVDAAGRLHFWALTTYYSASYPWGVLVTLGLDGKLTSTEWLYDPGTGTGGNLISNDVAGNIFVVIDHLRLASGQEHLVGYRTTADGSGVAPGGASFVDAYGYPSRPQGFAVDQAGHWYYTRASDSAIIRDSTVLAGVAAGPKDGSGNVASFDRARYLDVDATGTIWVLEEGWDYLRYVSSPSSVAYARLRKVTAAGTVSTPYIGPKMLYTPQHPAGLACDGAGGVYFATDTQSPAGIAINRITTDTPGAFLDTMDSYTFNDFASDAAGNLWTYSKRTWEIFRRPANGTWTALAGNPSLGIKDGKGTGASLGSPWSLATDKSGHAYFLDAIYDANYAIESCFIRKITIDGTVTTITPDLLKKETVNGAVVARYPTSLVLNSRGETIVINQHGILQLDAKGAETVLGGASATSGSIDAIGDKARFTFPSNLAVDLQDNLYVLDAAGATLRKGELLGYLPGITAQPQGQAVTAGGSVQFSVTATSTPAPTYQWYFNGSPFQGATGNTLSFASVRSSDAGDYTVVVTNSLGSVTSARATLTVAGAPVPPPPASSGGSGGGGAPSGWFVLALSILGVARKLARSTVS